MARLPRLAVGTVQSGADGQAILWALMEGLRREEVQVQSFLSRACFPAYQGAAAVTGLAPRHLDSWLMSPQTCRELFAHGAGAADLALVEGDFSSPADGQSGGGQLEPLCQWLDLPRLAVVDVAQIRPCRLPPRPEHVEGLLLDRVDGDGQLARLITDLEALWGIPVLGSLASLPRLRSELTAVPRGNRPPHELCQELGDHFTRHWQPQRILQIASRRDWPNARCWPRCCCQATTRPLIAIGYDEAFNCYFSDALDLLESLGATIVDFSPLRDESLPAGTDVVYLGCGHPERYAATLSENHCMKAALRSHLRVGRRIYGEGGGAAYLCQHLEMPGGRLKRMAGILPATARLRREPAAPAPAEVTLARSNWLGDRGSRLRGYRNSLWRFEPVAPGAGFVGERDHQYDLIGSFQAVGSLLHLNFAAQPGFLEQFFRASLCPPAVPDPWTAVI